MIPDTENLTLSANNGAQSTAWRVDTVRHPCRILFVVNTYLTNLVSGYMCTNEELITRVAMKARTYMYTATFSVIVA